MNDKPLVSILIPVYNREKLVERAIESSCAQDYPNIEIIIVDNHSTDNTWNILQEWAKKDSRIRIFQNEENIGPVRNWSRCFDEAKGLYSKILWSDDWMSADFVRKAVEKIDDDTAFVLSGAAIVNEKGEIRSRYSFKQNKCTSIDYIKDVIQFRQKNYPYSPGCALFRTEDLRKNLLIKVPNDEALDSSRNGAGNDLLLFLSTALHYKKIEILQEPLNFFYAHSGSFSVSSPVRHYYEWAMFYFAKENNLTEMLYAIKYWAWWNYWKRRYKEYKGIYEYTKGIRSTPQMFCSHIKGLILSKICENTGG